MFGKKSRRPERGEAAPRFESLEPRLLLTTVEVFGGPDAFSYFVYRNTRDDLVLVTLYDEDSHAAVELMAWDSMLGDVVDMPGNLNGTPVAGGITGTANLDTIIGNDPWTGLVSVLTLAAASDGTVYAYDDVTGHLWTIDTGTGAADIDLGQLIDSQEPTFGYTLTAMTTDAADTIYAIGTLIDLDITDAINLPAPAGPFLVTIAPNMPPVATRVPPNRTLAPVPAQAVNDMTFAGGTLYATDGNDLLTIGPASATVLTVGTFSDITAAPPVAVTGMTGLQYFNGTLYGVAGTAVYSINVTNAQCTPLNGQLSQSDLTDMASDGTLVYGMFSSNDVCKLCVINTDPLPNVEIFSVYVADADASTVLTFSTVGEDGQDNAPLLPYSPWGKPQTDIHLYASTNTPFTGGGALNAPAGSGGVLIGGILSPVQGDLDRHVAVDVVDLWVDDASPLGVYPGGDLYSGITSAGPMAADLNGDLGLGVFSLAGDSTGMLYAVDDVTHQLLEITYDPTAPTGSRITWAAVGQLVDSADATWVHVNVMALDFDDSDNLWVISTMWDTEPGDPTPPAGRWLSTVDTTTGEVTRVVQVADELSDVQSLAFDGPTLYAVGAYTDPVSFETTENALMTIDTGTGAVTLIDEILYNAASLDAVTGMDFMAGTLYATTGLMLYTINPATAEATPVSETGVGDLSGLAYSDGGDLAGYLWGLSFTESYQVVRLDLNAETKDMGRILLAGTGAGRVYVSGSLGLLEIGHLWGNVEIGHDLGNLVVQTDAGRALGGGATSPDNVLIQVQGVLGELDVYGNSYATVSVLGRPGIPHPHDDLVDLNAEPILEIEYKYPTSMASPQLLWVEQGLVMTVNNDTTDQAQFLANETGSLLVWGELAGPNSNDVEDYYAISLMAGQTIELSVYYGWETDPRMMWPAGEGLATGVYDSDMRYMGSYGFETYEDYGFGSLGINEEPLWFTAPEAGVYYLLVGGGAHALITPGAGGFTVFTDYTLYIRDVTEAAMQAGPFQEALGTALSATLGAVHINGDYAPQYAGLGTRADYDIEVLRGNLGTVQVDGICEMSPTYGVLVQGGGNLVAVRVGRFGTMLTTPSLVLSDGSIGMVQTTTDYFYGDIVAGAATQIEDRNAFIQNIDVATDFRDGMGYVHPLLEYPYNWAYGAWAAGSIGTAEIGGSVLSSFTINGDGEGPTSYMDLLHVVGDWRGALSHGGNADFRMVDVEADIYTNWGTWWGILDPTTYSEGRTTTLDDDGGGQVRIVPGLQINPDGTPVLAPDPVTGRDVPVPTSYSYWVIPVEGKTGGVLARLEATGPVNLSVLGPGHDVDVGYVQLTGAGDYNLTGAGRLHVYHLNGTGMFSLNSATTGDLVSGSFDALANLTVKGSLGRTIGHLAQWLPGPEDAPATSQMGWFHGRINGVHIAGDTQQVKVAGWLGDLLVDGQADLIRVNSDNLSAPDVFEGVLGVVEANILGKIYVGDGLADDGSGDRAMAAIIGVTGIDGVYIDGPGRILNGAVMAVGLYGADEPPGINEVIGTNGAINTAIICSGDLEAYKVFHSSALSMGWINRISFSGPGAAISGSEMFADFIRTVSTSVDSEGIEYSYITAHQTPPDTLGIGQVLAGGPGLFNSEIGCNGGRVGVIRGVGPRAEIRLSLINVTDSVGEITGQSIFGNTIMVPVELTRIHAVTDMTGNVATVGKIGTLTVGTDFSGNTFDISSYLGSAKIGGHFYESELTLQGPEDAKLVMIDVAGNISGSITSHGLIGTIKSGGTITADIVTIDAEFKADIGTISVQNGYSGRLEVAGSLGSFISYNTLGTNPSDLPDYTPLRFSIAADLGSLRVVAPRNGGPRHLYTSVFVGGDADQIDVDGALYADLRINGNLGTLCIDGDMGGEFNVPMPTTLGNVTVLGELKSLKMPDGANIVGDLTIGGTIGKINMTDRSYTPGRGDIVGTVTSLYGSILNVTLSGGSIVSGLTAAGRIDKITLKGQAGDPASITGEIVALNGGIKSITITNGNLDADVRAEAGSIDKLMIKGGSAMDGRTIYASANVGSVMIRDGDLDADLEAGAALKTLVIVGGDLTGDVTVAGAASKVNVLGNVDGGSVWIGGGCSAFVFGGNLNGATIGSLYDIKTITVKGSVVNSEIVAGYNADTGEAHSADVGKVAVLGNWAGSVLALGVEPGADGLWGTGDETPAPGVSVLGTFDVKGTADPAGSWVLVDTAYKAVPVGLAGVTQIVDGPSPSLDPSPPAVHFTSGVTTAGDGLVINYRGDGTGSYDPATGQMVLLGTGGRASLTLSLIGAAKTVHVSVGDDDGFNSLVFSGGAEAGDLSIDGAVRKLAAGTVAAGATWDLLGEVRSVTTGGLTGVNVNAGALGKWKMTGPYLRESDEGLVADAIAGLDIAGRLTASVRTRFGEISQLTVRGPIDGSMMDADAGEVQIEAANGIRTLKAEGITGDVHVAGGDLKMLSSNGNVVANVTVAAGALGRFMLTGSFGSWVTEVAVRALAGIDNFSVRGGDVYGIICTCGDIKSLQISDAGDGFLFGRVRAGGSINRVSVDAMQGGLVAAGGDVRSVQVRGDMVHSTIIAGVDPEDGGYDEACGGEAANAQFDGRTLADWRTPANADVIGGGDIRVVTIGGDMIASAISAAVGAGSDGWFGTADDQVRGTGYITRVKVRGGIYGSFDPDEHYGIFAASCKPNVTAGSIILSGSNCSICMQPAGVGAPRVVGFETASSSITVYFDHDIDFSTINTAMGAGMDPLSPTTFQLVVSRNNVFGPTEADDVSISDTVSHSITYDDLTHSLTLTLTGRTFYTLNRGSNFLLTIDGLEVTNRRGVRLDGEYIGQFPSGNGLEGGDFVYRFVHGDAGATYETAVELTGGYLLQKNQVFNIVGRIGDNDPAPAASDIDMYKIHMAEGDILYHYCDDQYGVGWWLDDPGGILSWSLTGAGDRADTDGDVYIVVEYWGSAEAYTLPVLLFNDGDSNFDFDDATQTPTGTYWYDLGDYDKALLTSGVSDPTDKMIAATVVAPDDVDMYDLGVLPAYTEIHVALDTIVIGSQLSAKMAVFDSEGEMVGSIVFPESLPDTDIGLVEKSITLEVTALTPAEDTYYLAVTGANYPPEYAYSGDFRDADTGRYHLTVTKRQSPAPVFSPQVVYLNFDGGVADYLSEQFYIFGEKLDEYQEPFSATTFGFDADETQELINKVVEIVEGHYSAFGNITFTTVRPAYGEYSTVFISDNIAPEPGVGGIAEKIDTNNGDHGDDCVVFGGEMAFFYNTVLGDSLDDIAKVMGNLASHELGHILGLNHVGVPYSTDRWVMTYPDTLVDDMTFTDHAQLFPDEFLVGYQDSVASLWSIQ